MKRLSFLVFFIFITTTQLTFASDAENQAFQKAADEYIDDVYFPNNPVAATEAGVHRYDHMLGNFSKESLARELDQLNVSEKQIEAINPAELSPWTRDDREIVLNQIRSLQFALTIERDAEKNPDFYSSHITNAIFMLMNRDFAPVNERLKSIIAREKQIPEAIAQAKINLNNPPKIFTEIAIQQLPDDIRFFEKDLPNALANATDAALITQFEQSNAATLKALQDYQAWLKTNLLPRSHGDFKLGAKNYQKKLALEEMVDIPLKKLLAINEEDTKRNQENFIRYAKIIDPDLSPKAVQEAVAKNHPKPDQLLATFSDSYAQVIAFIEKEHIISLPANVPPRIIETPPFLRATTFASMDSPGPFETGSKEAFFSVTLPDTSWTPAEIEDYMSSFTYPLIFSTVIHEAYPGHYVQFLFAQQLNDRVRQLFYANSNVEGWAHYTEQMMADAGFIPHGADEKALAEYHLGQAQDALLRNARFTVGIKLHTGAMSFADAVNYFEKTAYLSKKGALMEAKRGTSDPTYLIYTLGKLEILKLRADYAKKMGRDFSLQEFHDAFMHEGYAPIKLVRRAMLQDNSAPL